MKNVYKKEQRTKNKINKNYNKEEKENGDTEKIKDVMHKKRNETKENEKTKRPERGFGSPCKYNGIRLSFFKPGKETFEFLSSGERKNQEDMIVVVSSKPRWRASLAELTITLTAIRWAKPNYYNELVALLTRMVYYVDHEEFGNNQERPRWVAWMPSEGILNRIKKSFYR